MSVEVVLDASVVVKWFVEEEGSREALEIRDRYVEGEIQIIAPELITYEVLNALYYKRLFSEDELKLISEALEAYSFSLYPLRGEYAKKAVEVSYENDITLYDASYVALAIVRDTFTYTADERLIRKLGKVYRRYIRSLRSDNSK